MKECAFDNGNNCIALSEKQCEGCHFCKTTEELKAGRQKAEKRISSLPEDIRTHIAKKYYSKC